MGGGVNLPVGCRLLALELLVRCQPPLIQSKQTPLHPGSSICTPRERYDSSSPAVESCGLGEHEP
jgi:hypothetical protein